VEVLNAIYELTSSASLWVPARTQPAKALDALFCGLHQRRVNWVLDLDVRSFFDRLSP